MPRKNAPRRRPARKSKRTYRKKRPTTNSAKSMARDNFARCSAISKNTVLASNTAYSFTYQLANATERVLNVAKAYQEFKIDYVEVRLKPLYDTYSTATPTVGITAPQLYHQIIKDMSVEDIVSPAQFRANGVNAMSFARDGNKVWRYKPAASILNNADGPTAVSSGMIKVSPWLDTEAQTSTPTIPVFSETAHYGTAMWIDTLEATQVPVATIEVEVHYVFRKPRSDEPAPEGLVSTKVSL